MLTTANYLAGLSLLQQAAAMQPSGTLMALAPAASAATGLLRGQGLRCATGGAAEAPSEGALATSANASASTMTMASRSTVLLKAGLRRGTTVVAAPMMGHGSRALLRDGAGDGWSRPVGRDGTKRHCSEYRTFATSTTPPGPGHGHGGGGAAWGPPSHGPGPGLPLESTGPHGAPLPRPDQLRPGALPDPVNIAADHEGDPRDVIQRLILQSVPGLGAAMPSWGSDRVDNPELRAHQEQHNPLAAVINSSGPLSPEQLRRLSGADLSVLAMAVLPTLSPGRVAQLSVALARLGHFDMGYKAVLVEHVVGRMYQFTPQQLADVAWAVAACGYYDLPFLEALAGRLRGTAPQWDARSLAKVLWAFGRFHFVGREPSVGAEALEAMVEKLQDDLDGATVAEVVYAAGQLCGSGAGDWQFTRLQGMVADFALMNMDAFGPEALGKLASGLNELGVAGVEQELCEAVACRAAELAHRLEPEDICRVMELLESHGKRSYESLEALARRAVELSRPPLERLSHAQAAELVSGFNTLSHVSPAVLELAGRSNSIASMPGGFVG